MRSIYGNVVYHIAASGLVVLVCSHSFRRRQDCHELFHFGHLDGIRLEIPVSAQKNRLATGCILREGVFDYLNAVGPRLERGCADIEVRYCDDDIRKFADEQSAIPVARVWQVVRLGSDRHFAGKEKIVRVRLVHAGKLCKHRGFGMRLAVAHLVDAAEVGVLGDDPRRSAVGNDRARLVVAVLDVVGHHAEAAVRNRRPLRWRFRRLGRRELRPSNVARYRRVWPRRRTCRQLLIRQNAAPHANFVVCRERVPVRIVLRMPEIQDWIDETIYTSCHRQRA